MTPIDRKAKAEPWTPPAVPERSRRPTPRLPVRQSVRTTASVYAATARILIPAALVLSVPLGLLDAGLDHLGPVEVEKLDLYTSLLLFGALAQFAAAAFGDTFYTGVTASAVLQARGRGSHSLWEIARTLPYGRLIVVDLILTLGTTIGLGLFLIPGVVFFTWFALAAPVIKIERLGVVAAMRRSRGLVRGSFSTVLLLLGTLYFASNVLTPAAQELATLATGGAFLGEWVGAVVIGVAVDPIVGVTAVVIALELIELHRPLAEADRVAA